MAAKVFCAHGHPVAPGMKRCPTCGSDIEKYGLTAQERSAEKYRSIEQTPRAVVSLLVVFAVLALIIWGIVALVGGGGGGASLEGHFISWIPEDSAHGYALISVTNHGTKGAEANCSVVVQTDFGDVGFDYLDGTYVGPGETVQGRVPLTVQNNAAFNVRTGDVKDC